MCWDLHKSCTIVVQLQSYWSCCTVRRYSRVSRELMEEQQLIRSVRLMPEQEFFSHSLGQSGQREQPAIGSQPSISSQSMHGENARKLTEHWLGSYGRPDTCLFKKIKSFEARKYLPAFLQSVEFTRMVCFHSSWRIFFMRKKLDENFGTCSQSFSIFFLFHW